MELTANTYGGEHTDRETYQRYHYDVYMPETVRAAAKDFLPAMETELGSSPHYDDVRSQRNLPVGIRMPRYFSIIDVTVVRATQVIYRVMIREEFSVDTDLCLVLDGDYKLVTGFWISRWDQHPTLDTSVYEQEDVEPRTKEEQQVRDEQTIW